MAKIIFKLNSVSDEEACDIKDLLTENEIDFYESPAGNWGISMHALWIKDESQYDQSKQLIDDYQTERSHRISQEKQQQMESGEIETFVQRLLNRPLQVLSLLAIILFILYFSIMPFIDMGQS